MEKEKVLNLITKAYSKDNTTTVKTIRNFLSKVRIYSNITTVDIVEKDDCRELIFLDDNATSLQISAVGEEFAKPCIQLRLIVDKDGIIVALDPYIRFFSQNNLDNVLFCESLIGKKIIF